MCGTFFEIKENLPASICCVNLSPYCTRYYLNRRLTHSLMVHWYDSMYRRCNANICMHTVIMNYSIKFYVTPSQKQTANTHWAVLVHILCHKMHLNTNGHGHSADGKCSYVVATSCEALFLLNLAFFRLKVCERARFVYIVALTVVGSIAWLLLFVVVVVVFVRFKFYLIENWWNQFLIEHRFYINFWLRTSRLCACPIVD